MGASFRDLQVWKRAFEMTLSVYELTSSFPEGERFGLTNQLRRASVSVASNIAEGYGRASKGEYLQFLGHARGSIYEVQAQLEIAQALRFGNHESHQRSAALAAEVGRMLVALMKSLRETHRVPNA